MSIIDRKYNNNEMEGIKISLKKQDEYYSHKVIRPSHIIYFMMFALELREKGMKYSDIDFVFDVDNDWNGLKEDL